MTRRKSNALNFVVGATVSMIWAIGLWSVSDWILHPPRQKIWTTTDWSVTPAIVKSEVVEEPIVAPAPIDEKIARFLFRFSGDPHLWEHQHGSGSGAMDNYEDLDFRDDYRGLAERIVAIGTILLVAAIVSRFVIRRPRDRGFEIIPTN